MNRLLDDIKEFWGLLVFFVYILGSYIWMYYALKDFCYPLICAGEANFFRTLIWLISPFSVLAEVVKLLAKALW